MMVVSAVIPTRPRAVCTRSSAKRALPGTLVNGDHGVEARRRLFVCGRAVIVVPTMATAAIMTSNPYLRVRRKLWVVGSDGVHILFKPQTRQLADLTITQRNAQNNMNGKPITLPHHTGIGRNHTQP